MSPIVKDAINAVHNKIDTLAESMTREEYVDFIGELGADMQGRQDCIDEEEKTTKGE
jgi:hypothetical protein